MELGSQWDNYYKHLTCVKCNAKFEDAKKQAKGVVYFYGGVVGVQDGGMLCFSCKEEIFANAGASRRSSRGGMKNTKNSDKKKKNEQNHQESGNSQKDLHMHILYFTIDKNKQKYINLFKSTKYYFSFLC